jgi:hypothetical protein
LENTTDKPIIEIMPLIEMSLPKKLPEENIKTFSNTVLTTEKTVPILPSDSFQRLAKHRKVKFNS